MTCKKAQGYLEENVVRVRTVADAGKNKQGRAEVLALARQAAKIIIARGKKIVTFDMKKDPPDDDSLAAHLLGPTGNLRAPTARVGKTLLVGFSEEAYQQVLGS